MNQTKAALVFRQVRQLQSNLAARLINYRCRSRVCVGNFDESQVRARHAARAMCHRRNDDSPLIRKRRILSASSGSFETLAPSGRKILSDRKHDIRRSERNSERKDRWAAQQKANLFLCVVPVRVHVTHNVYIASGNTRGH